MIAQYQSIYLDLRYERGGLFEIIFDLVKQRRKQLSLSEC